MSVIHCNIRKKKFDVFTGVCEATDRVTDIVVGKEYLTIIAHVVGR